MFTRLYYKALAASQALNMNSTSYSIPVKNYLGNTVKQTSFIEKYVTNCAVARKYFMKSAKDASNITGSNAACIAFGDGDTPPTLDDYQLSGNHITTYSVTNETQFDFDAGNSVTTYTITNTGTSAFTIKEIGIVTSTSTAASDHALIFREVLDAPVTIEPGGVGQVTLTLGVAIPT